MNRHIQLRLPAVTAAIATLAATPPGLANGQTPIETQPPPPMQISRGPLQIQDTGTKEIELGAGFSHTQGSNVGVLNANVAFGYYVAPRLDIGVRQTLNYAFLDNAPDTWTASTVPFINYSFETSNPYFRPFIGAFAGAVYNDNDVTGTIGPTVGIRFYLNTSTAIVARYSYEWFFDKLSFKDVRDTTDGNNIVTLGFSYSWK